MLVDNVLGLNHVLTIIDKLTSEQANFLSRLLGLEKEIIRKCHFISTNFGCIDARTEIATSTSQLLVHSPLSSIDIQTQASSTRSFLAVFHPSTVLAQSCFFNPYCTYQACLASSCTARHSFFYGKTVMLNLREGPV